MADPTPLVFLNCILHKEEPIKDDRKETGTFLDSIYTNKPGMCSERMAFVLCCIACLFYMAFRSILNIHDGRKLLDFIAKAGLRHIVAKKNRLSILRYLQGRCNISYSISCQWEFLNLFHTKIFVHRKVLELWLFP